MLAVWVGRVPYRPAFELQQIVAQLRAEEKLPDTMLLLEHDPVYTLGRRAPVEEILLDDTALAERGIEVERTDRGGRVTYHGPGQLVGYPIVRLATADLVGYVRSIERALIAVCADFGVDAGTIDGLTGVWSGDRKLGAIGIHVSRGITTHGFALNVNTDLSMFNGIVPCGIVDRGVTSLEEITGAALAMDDVVRSAKRRVGEALGAFRVVDASAGDLGLEVGRVGS
ncbi:MAG: lipoyl(octanoyl) transferase LipB [Actinobacteria bacterium]|nr:MAG: lipoyl(octanoyl) transferase LipB [Actinomycetota bacterium]